jgi:hypothetical protein
MPEKPIHPELAAVLSEIELSFFRRGEHDAPLLVERFEDLDEDYEPTRFWSRVFRGQRPATEPLPVLAPALPVLASAVQLRAVASLEDEEDGEDEDEEWQWKIRIARARAATGG